MNLGLGVKARNIRHTSFILSFYVILRLLIKADFETGI